MTLTQVLRECRELMDKSVGYLERELRGIRTGRATTALIEYVKVDYYGSPTEIRELAAVSVPEATLLLVKPFDPTVQTEIAKAIETAGLGLNPMVDGPSIRISVPSPSAERRQHLTTQVRKLAEDAKVAVRNERRDAMKQVEKLVKDSSNDVSEDAGKGSKSEIDDLTKEHTGRIDQLCQKKVEEIEEI